MNLLLFEREELAHNGRVRITGERLRHLQQVHGKAVGDTLRVGEIGGNTGTATILSIDGRSALLATRLDESPPEKLPLILASHS